MWQHLQLVLQCRVRDATENRMTSTAAGVQEGHCENVRLKAMRCAKCGEMKIAMNQNCLCQKLEVLLWLLK